VAERAKVTRQYWAAVDHECIYGEGFVTISKTLRTVPTIEKLPVRYFKAMEGIRFRLASPSTFDARC
jgi:hypothetical protein